MDINNLYMRCVMGYQDAAYLGALCGRAIKTAVVLDDHNNPVKMTDILAEEKISELAKACVVGAKLSQFSQLRSIETPIETEFQKVSGQRLPEMEIGKIEPYITASALMFGTGLMLEQELSESDSDAIYHLYHAVRSIDLGLSQNRRFFEITD